jgi:hypothetical protein
VGKRSALSEFCHVLLTESQQLQNAVYGDAYALEYARVVWEHRRNPPTEEDRTARELKARSRLEESFAKCGMSPKEAAEMAAAANVSFDPEDYLKPHTYQLVGETVETPAQITEEDVQRYASRIGTPPDDANWNEDRTCVSWFVTRKSRTSTLIDHFRSLGKNGFDRAHLLHRAAIDEATGRGLGAVLAPLLIDAYRAHQAFTIAAREAEDRGEKQVENDAMIRHIEAVNALMPYLPPDEQEEVSIHEPAAAVSADTYVTLKQAAAMVQRSKDTLERLVTDGKLPPPDIRTKPKSGKPHEWKWSTIRPALEAEYKRALPEVFPTIR